MTMTQELILPFEGRCSVCSAVLAEHTVAFHVPGKGMHCADCTTGKPVPVLIEAQSALGGGPDTTDLGRVRAELEELQELVALLALSEVRRRPHVPGALTKLGETMDKLDEVAGLLIELKGLGV